MWDLPGPGLKPVSPALAGGFLTTAPPGKSEVLIITELGIALKGLQSPWYGVGHHGLLLSVLHSGIHEDREKEGLESESCTLYTSLGTEEKSVPLRT